MANYECGHCNRTAKVTANSIQELSGIDKALCVKHGMNPSVMVKVECPKCGKVALVNKDRLPDSDAGGSASDQKPPSGPGLLIRRVMLLLLAGVAFAGVKWLWDTHISDWLQ